VQRLRHTIAAVAVAVLAAAGCGAGDPIPANTAASIIRGLDDIEQRVDAGECRRARTTLRALERRVRALPDKVDSETRSTTEAGVARLAELVQTQCKPKPKPEPEPVTPTPPVQQTPQEEPTVEQPTEPDPVPEEPTRDEPQNNDEPQSEPQPEEPKKPEEPKPPKLKGDGQNPCPPGAEATC
jgi:hypothetical protein